VGDQLKGLIKNIVLKKIVASLGITVLTGILILTIFIAMIMEILSSVPVVGNSLAEEYFRDIEAIEAMGLTTNGLINPDKIPIYTKYESESIPANQDAKSKSYKVVREEKTDLFSLDIEASDTNIFNMEDIVIDINNTTYPYRLWWQALGGLDIHLTSATNIDDVDAINTMAEELKPVFIFSFTDDEFKYNERIEKSTYYSEKKYEDGVLVRKSDHQEDILTLTPLPYLEHVSTMFEEISFSYKYIKLESENWKYIHTSSNETDEYRITPNGSYIYLDDRYILKSGYAGERDILLFDTYEKIKVKTVNKIMQKYDIYTYEISENRSNNNRFIEFCETYDFDGRLDLQNKTFIIDYAGFLPNSYDFIYTANKALNYNGFTMNNGGYNGSESGEYEVVDNLESEFIFPIKFDENCEKKYFTISSPFGMRTITVNGIRTTGLHGAIDIPIPVGTPIVAAASGKVIISRYSSIGGNMIVIDHGNDYKTTYMHLSKSFVAEDVDVIEGKVIGISGNTGKSTGPHLHFSIHENEVRIDPVPLLPVIHK